MSIEDIAVAGWLVETSFDGERTRLGYVNVSRDVTDRRPCEETTRTLLANVITTQEGERRRIARELDDETAQTLTSLLVGLQAVEDAHDLPFAREAAGLLSGHRGRRPRLRRRRAALLHEARAHEDL